MFKRFKKLIVSAIGMAAVGIVAGTYVIAGGPADVEAKDKRISESNVYKFADGTAVPGATSTLVRDKDGITGTLNTDELTVGNAYTLWWVIFNNPENCQHPVPGLAACGEDDVFGQPLGDTNVKVSVQVAAGNVIGGTGMASFGAHLDEGEIPGGLGQHVFGPGLKNSKKAEVHLVVRDHGPVVPSIEFEQITTFGGGCSAASDPSGTGPEGPAPYACFDEQFAVHQAP